MANLPTRNVTYCFHEMQIFMDDEHLAKSFHDLEIYDILQ